MNLSEFTKQKQQESKDTKNFMDTYNELKDMNSDQLTNKLFQEVASQKASGKFDYNMLNDSVERIRNYLPPETYENIKRILITLK